MNAVLNGEKRDLGFFQAAWLVARREMKAQVSSKAFKVSLAIMLVVAFGGVLALNFFSGRDDDSAPRVAVVAQTRQAAKAAGLEVKVERDADAARASVKAGDVDAAVLPGGQGLTVVANKEAPQDIVLALSSTPRVELLQDESGDNEVRYALGTIFGAFFLFMGVSFGATLLQNTIVEKQTRTVEILLTAVPARVLLAGKIVGNALMTYGQVIAVAAVVMLALSITGQTAIFSAAAGPVVWYILFLAVGFLAISALYTAGGSMVSKIEDSGSVQIPGMLCLMVPYFGAIFLASNDTAYQIMSYVPFFSSIVMPVQLYVGEASWWQALISLALIVVVAFGLLTLAAKIYTNSVLQTGSRLKLRQALRGV